MIAPAICGVCCCCCCGCCCCIGGVGCGGGGVGAGAGTGAGTCGRFCCCCCSNCIADICGITAFGFCSVIFCKKLITAASFAATIDRSCTNNSCSRFIFAISCIRHCSSLAIRSRSRLSNVSRNFACNSSCLSTTSFINFPKNSFHFRFRFLRLSGGSSSEDVEDELEFVEAEIFNCENGNPPT
ncbi:hypothetical protein HanXRQr2_Chr05g0236131 [Helianthus annuus]|uniref:Secreted protein n=1 Tax=Helianthus annuus TaxID=4232 RepID=A0A9K3J3J0_HELAN|nr:hypothetical protein HanXRQr2_Chr05g0236131 [Helianthus annuus]KAJ0571755.1 hypothetical protein HanHA300_Chr05g0193631 [Helianthus annuus]KAJ0586131.1 hypothetical protein HanHA89_Chr05g0208451 [Helianthus annuus]KAJ0924404.1 hypothetical protein HanPSC8_Chr05g0227771 [Helianthus annuus]